MSTDIHIHKPRISADKFAAWQEGIRDQKQAMDAFSNIAARLGTGSNNLLEGTAYPLTRLSFNYILMQSLYRSNWIIRKVIDVPAEDMTKNWISLTVESDPKQMKRFEQAVKLTGTQNQMLTTLKWARLFGGAGGVIVIKGHEKKLDKPLELEDVAPDSYRGIIPLDRWSGIVPEADVCIDIERPLDFGLPEFYRVITTGGKNFKVHASRVVRFIGKDLPVWEKQVEQNWGISEVEVMFDELKKRDNTSWNIASLIFRANIVAIRSKELAGMLSGMNASQQAQQRLFQALQAQAQLMSNQGMMVVPEEGGLDEHQYSFGGVADVYEAFREDICGATGIPYSRMFGRTPGGLSTTNEGEEHIYYESISAKQQRELDPQATKLFPVIAMSVWGEVPDDFGWKWNPVGSLSDKDRVELGAGSSTAVGEIYNLGVISPKLVLKELKQQSGITGMWTNITDDDIENASDEVLPVADEMMMGGFGESDSGDDSKDKASGKAKNKNKSPDSKPSKKAGSESKSRKAQDDIPSEVEDTVMFAGLHIAIENPVGSVRSGEGWSMKMSNDYGYIVGSIGVDGDAVDVFLGPNEFAPKVHVVHTQGDDPEDKVMLGFDSASDAKAAFEKNYSHRGFFGSMDALSLADFTRKIFSKKLGKKIA
jgi:phage-related protein (TIGR01555 family)